MKMVLLCCYFTAKQFESMGINKTKSYYLYLHH